MGRAVGASAVVQRDGRGGDTGRRVSFAPAGGRRRAKKNRPRRRGRNLARPEVAAGWAGTGCGYREQDTALAGGGKQNHSGPGVAVADVFTHTPGGLVTGPLRLILVLTDAVFVGGFVVRFLAVGGSATGP